ncbi:MAG: helix-turn-helix domain-containing protein [Pseudomonadota bacterium]
MFMNSKADTSHRIAQGFRIRPSTNAKRGKSSRANTNRHEISEEAGVAMCDALLDLLSEILEVPSSMLRSSTRSSASVARGRQIGMYLAHTCLGLPMSHVASGFSRNKSTVVHACHTIEDMRDDPTFDAFIARQERIIAVIKQGQWHAASVAN